MVLISLLINVIIAIRWDIHKVSVLSLWDIQNGEIILMTRKTIIKNSKRPQPQQLLKQKQKILMKKPQNL